MLSFCFPAKACTLWAASGKAVISAVVSTIPYQERKAISNEHGILVKLLKECSSVDAALAKKKIIFKAGISYVG